MSDLIAVCFAPAVVLLVVAGRLIYDGVIQFRRNRPAKPLFTCGSCHRDVYPPVYRSMHVGDKHYCQACEAAWFAQAGVAVRERHAK
jgi:hypothetical protein